MAKDKKGQRFEREVMKTLKGMGIECYGSHGQIQLRNLYPKESPSGHIEIDIICLEKGVCILIETTTERSKPSRKIKRFIRHCKLINECQLEKLELFSHFQGIPEDKLPNFTGVTTWRYLYVGTSSELTIQKISPKDFPETDCLQIFDEENWEYFKNLERAIKSTAKYEFFASQKISPRDLKDSALGASLPPRKCLELTNVSLGSGQARATIVVAIFTPDELLQVARVARYQGQPLTVSAKRSTSIDNSTPKTSSGYQRLLSHQKLENLAGFIDDNSSITFPTNLTLVLSKECKIDENGLHIPFEYASIDVIDGQHRLFSYTLSDNEQVRRESKLIVTAIKFNTNDSEKINRYAAQTFITINREQTKVKRDLILLISYDVLDVKTPESVAAKVLKTCDSKHNGVLARIFAIKAFIKKNQFDQTPIPIISVIEELARISKLENLNAIRNTLGERIGDTEENEETYEILIQNVGTLLESYFSQVESVFSKDWGNGDSLLMCAKYIGAFIRLLGTLVDKQFTLEQVEAELYKIRHNILTTYDKGRVKGSTVVFYPGAYHSAQKNLPSKRGGSVKEIHELLNFSRL